MPEDLRKYDHLVDIFDDQLIKHISNHILQVSLPAPNKNRELAKFFSKAARVGPKMRALLISIIEKDFPEHKKLLDKILLLV
jgi:hypothetical protein